MADVEHSHSKNSIMLETCSSGYQFDKENIKRDDPLIGDAYDTVIEMIDQINIRTKPHVDKMRLGCCDALLCFFSAITIIFYCYFWCWFTARKLAGAGLYFVELTTTVDEYNQKLSKYNLEVIHSQGPPDSKNRVFYLELKRGGVKPNNTNQPVTNNQIDVEDNNGN